MRTSDETDQIAPAWAKALTAMPHVSKDSPGHHGRYATIGAVLNAARPVNRGGECAARA